MNSKFQFKKSLEWCTELPGKDCPRESPLFLANGSEWFFRFCLEETEDVDLDFFNEWQFSLYLDFKCTHTEFKPCRGKLQVGFVKEQTLILGKQAFVVSETTKKLVWCSSVENIQSKLPSSYFKYAEIKFIFSFDVITGSVLKICKELEDKGVQTASYLNADISKESLLKDFSELLDTGLNHDIEIKCREHSIKSHKTVLCVRSDVFRAMLRSDMQECQTGVMEVQDMDVNYFQDFVRYLYTDTMPELTFDKAKALYEAGDKYNVKSLMLRCSEYFQDILTPENIFQSFTLADAHSDLKLKDKIITYILEEKVYLQSEYWLPFYENYPKVALEVYKFSYEKILNKKG